MIHSSVSQRFVRFTSLTFIRDAFNLSDKTRPTKVRDGSLGQMAVLGVKSHPTPTPVSRASDFAPGACR